jgi:hypothetical protein
MKPLLLIILLFIGQIVQAQDKLAVKDNSNSREYLDSLTNFTRRLRARFNNPKLNNGDKVFTKAYYDAFFSRWLAYVNFAKDGYPDGNSVQVATNSANTQTRATLAYKSGFFVYNAGTQVNLSNNIGNILTKSNVTSNTTFFASGSILPKLTRGIYYQPYRAQQNNDDKIALLDKYMANTRKKYVVDYAADSVKYWQLLDSVTKAGGFDKAPAQMLASYYASMDKLRSYGFNENKRYYTNSLFFDQKIKTVQDSIRSAVDSITLANDAIEAFHFAWFTGSFAYTRNDYTTYNGTAPFAKRINDVYFDSVGFNVGYNFLFEHPPAWQKYRSNYFLDRTYLRSIYFTINYNIARDINYAHMTPVTLYTTRNISNPSNTGPIDTVYQLQSQGKGIDITNKPQVTSWAHTFSTKTFVILANSSIMGFDFSFNASYGKLIAPVYSTQIGLLLRYASSQDQKTKVNFELFLQLNDFGDSGQTGLSTWQRKVVGINIAIPFNKLFF